MIYVPPKPIRSAEAEWAVLLSAQENVFSIDQARALGWKDHEVRWKAESGRWQRVYRGVYATFPGPLPASARQWALVLLIGETAVLSHQTAAELQGFARGAASQIHVTVAMITQALKQRKKIPAGRQPSLCPCGSVRPCPHQAGMASGDPEVLFQAELRRDLRDQDRA